jgi:hypothetical protein
MGPLPSNARKLFMESLNASPRSAALVAALATALLGTTAVTAVAKPGSVIVTPAIPYMDDAPYVGHPCLEDTSILRYKVFYPDRAPGVTYPVVFVFQGAGFNSVSDCNPDTGQDKWLSMDNEATTWAANGFVAVNVEYHGVDATPPLYGDSTCPTPDCSRSQWGSAADGYVERNLKQAVDVFFRRNPLALYGADETKGLIAFGGSAGAHGAYMLALTSVRSVHSFDAAIGWSGMGDIAHAGPNAVGPYRNYMNATFPAIGSDQFDFGSPKVRVTSSGPAMYIANGQFESVVDPASAQGFYDQCVALGISRCWLRLLDSDQHATGYENYAFKGPIDQSEITMPLAPMGVTVFRESICFAHRVLGTPDRECP